MKDGLLVLLGWLLLASSAIAQTAFFTVWPGHPDFSPLPPSDIPGVEVEYPVAVDIRALARNRSARASYRLRFADGRTQVFVQQRFEAVEGFVELGPDDFQPDPRLPDSAISYYWYGLAGNEPLFVAVLHGQMVANLGARDHSYAITHARGQLVWRRFDPRLVPPDLHGSASSTLATVVKNAAHPKVLDFIDVLVLHTPAALAAVGGDQSQLDTEIGAAFMQSELALSNSGITSLRLRNVSGTHQSVLVNYNEAPPTPPGCTTTFPGLCRWIGHRVFLRTDPTVSALRNTAGADLVVMVVSDQANASGVAYVQRQNCGNEPSLETTPGCSIGAGYDAFAVAVVSLPFITSFQVFAHETGHQLGMEHNVTTAVMPSFPWSFGWFVNGQNETILSIRNGTASCNLGCPRAIQYSNPNIPFLGSTVASGAANAFNARTAAALAPAVSEFRNPLLIGLMFRSDFEALPIP